MSPSSDTPWLQRLVWLYFWLLIFEGVLRKWLLPQLSGPLLIIRDPVVVAIYAMAASRGKFPLNGFVLVTFVLAVLSTLASFGGQGTFAVTLFGLRTNFLHLPLIFVLPQVFTRREVVQMGRWTLYLAPVIALLVVQQFRSSPGSIWNTGAGGGEGGQIESSLGKIRPPGPFSFVTGMVAYGSLLVAFLFDHFARRDVYPQKLALLATTAVIVCLGLSGSRGSIVAVVVVGLAAGYVALQRPEFAQPLIKPLFWCGLIYGSLSLWSEFRLGLLVNAERFSAGGIQEGLVMRFLGGFLEPFMVAKDAPFFGYGLGLGTNAGASLMTGSAGFLMGEGEMPRVILESGPILGFAFLGLRLAIVLHLGLASMRQVRAGNPLPMLLFGACALHLLNGQFGPPTALGFAVLGGGLCLAACRVPESSDSSGVVDAPPLPAVLPRIRGRSVYAEALHGARYGSPVALANP